MPVTVADLLQGRGIENRPHHEVAVITMELQRGVIGDLATFPQLGEACEQVGVVTNVAALLGRARKVGVPVVHCTASFRADRAGTLINTPLHRAVLKNPAHLLQGTSAAALVPALGPDERDLVVDRVSGVSPFAGTSLEMTLKNLGVKTLIVTGVSVNLGVLGLCIEAVNLGFQVIIPVDCVAGIPAAYGRSVLDETLSLIATLSDVQELLKVMPEV